MKDHKAGYLSDAQNYQELSQLIKKSYSSSPPSISLHLQINQIQQWLTSCCSHPQKPLLLVSPQFSGKKTLLCQFLSTSISHTNTITICQFASVTPYYSQILYKITMQLRNHLDINQKVQLNQEKLRQYFSYWLEIADQKIERDYIGYLDGEKLRIVVVVEGVDKVVDGKGNFVRPSFWLPDINLKNIRMIYTAETGSSAAECLTPSISHKMQYIIPPEKQQQIKQKLYQKQPKLKKLSPDTHFGDLKVASQILKTHPHIQLQNNGISYFQFLRKFVQYLGRIIDSTDHVAKMFACLLWSKKGISKNTLRRSFKFSVDAVYRLLEAVKDIIIVSGDQSFLIINRRLKQYLSKIVIEKLGPEQIIKKQLHTLLSKALKKETYTLNTLQQLIYHMSSSGNFSQLKQLLSRIENFLVLYTPLTKHLLCMCWFTLQIQFQYNPVFEYNKAIQRFLNHYYPSPEDTFKIIFQLSLFFKQYSQFENSKTPQFRHPPIRGQVEHLRQISILDQLIHMNMYQKCKVKVKETVKSKKQARNSESRASVIQNASELSVEIVNQDGEKKEVQKLNVRIKFHQDKFKNLYLQEMESYLNQFFIIKKKSLMSKKDQLLDEDSDDSENEMDQSKIDLQRMKKGLLLKKFSDYCDQQYHRASSTRSFYYYKQWIWMQFPWICQSLNHQYSDLIDKCMKSPTQYMSIQMQSKLISEAVKIAKIAKQNKRQIYDNSIKVDDQIRCMTVKHGQNTEKNTERVSNVKEKHISKYKQKFDISQLDTLLKKNVKPKRIPNINQSSIFMTQFSASANLSCIQQDKNQKQNQSLHSSRLPSILKCSNIIRSRLQKNISITETREYKMLVAKYDELKHENQQLMEKIQSVQYNRECLKENSKVGLKDQLKVQIQEIKVRKMKLVKNYATQEALKAKLEMILKLCDINKSHGSQSADLQNFLNSLKTMFKIQQKNLQQVNQSAKRVLQDSKTAYRMLKQQKANLQHKLKQRHTKYLKSLKTIPLKETDRQPSKSKYVTKKKRNQNFREQLRKKQKYDREMDILDQQIRILNQKFGFVWNSKVANSSLSRSPCSPCSPPSLPCPCPNQQIFHSLQQKVDKLNQIEWKLNQLLQQNNSKDAQLKQLQDKLQITKGHRQHTKQIKSREMESHFNNQVARTQERVACLQKCFFLLDQARGRGNGDHPRFVDGL